MRLALLFFVAFVGLNDVAQAQHDPLSAASAQVADTSVTVQDARPPADRRRRSLSLNIADCSYGIWNLGDDQIASVSQLQSDLTRQLGTALAGKTIVVRRYAVLLNASTRLSGVAVAAGFGSVGMFGTSRVSTHAKCEHERTPLGWFDASELTNDFSPFVIEIAIEVDGRSYELRSVYSPPSDLVYPRRIFQREGTAEASVAMTHANERLAEMISSGD